MSLSSSVDIEWCFQVGVICVPMRFFFHLRTHSATPALALTHSIAYAPYSTTCMQEETVERRVVIHATISWHASPFSDPDDGEGGPSRPEESLSGRGQPHANDSAIAFTEEQVNIRAQGQGDIDAGAGEGSGAAESGTGRASDAGSRTSVDLRASERPTRDDGETGEPDAGNTQSEAVGVDDRGGEASAGGERVAVPGVGRSPEESASRGILPGGWDGVGAESRAIPPRLRQRGTTGQMQEPRRRVVVARGERAWRQSRWGRVLRLAL